MATNTNEKTIKSEEKVNEQKNRKTMKGVVISDKMEKTLVVRVDRIVQHPKYKKGVKVSKKYKAHYEGDKYGVGDKVVIEEVAPISKDKKWRVVEEVSPGSEASKK